MSRLETINWERRAQHTSTWKRLLGLASVVIESVIIEDTADGDLLVVAVRARRNNRPRCGRCGRRARWYDRGGPRRRWRHLDFAAVRVVLEAAVPRVTCPAHGVTTVALSWARHASRFTTAFEDQAAWLTAQAPASAVAELLGTTWRSVSGIVERVVAEAARPQRPVGRAAAHRYRRGGLPQGATAT